MDSAWRIVLLCKTCFQMVNSGKLCPYCFKDTVNSASDCVKCSDCDRFIHKDCVVKYSNSPPWSYSCRELGLGFSVCIDCWVPKLLKNSVQNNEKKVTTDKCVGELRLSKGDSSDLKKGKNGIISMEEVVKDANSNAGKKIAVAVKAKEKALRKSVLAKNAAALASKTLDLVTEKDCSNKNSEGPVTGTSDGSSANEVRFVGDAELAFQLHRAMNSSPRRSKSTCSMDHSCSDLPRVTDSITVTPKPNDLGSGEDGKVAACRNTVANGPPSNVLGASAWIRTIESVSDISAAMLRGEIKTYIRNGRRRREAQANVQNDPVAMPPGVAGNTAGDGSRVVAETQSCQVDKLKQELRVNDSSISSPHSCKIDVVRDNGSVNRRPDRYALKYGRMVGCRRGLFKVVNFTHEEASSDRVSFQDETRASASGFPMDCSMNCSPLLSTCRPVPL